MVSLGDVQFRRFRCPACCEDHADLTAVFHVGLILGDLAEYRIDCPTTGRIMWLVRKDWHDPSLTLMAITEADGDAQVQKYLGPLVKGTIEVKEDGNYLVLIPTTE